MIYWLIAFCIVLLFGVVALRGAPYVPTHRRTIHNALDDLDINHDDLVVDLGSGDGNILRAVARRGAKAIGYEINPVLWAVSWLASLPWRSQIMVRLRDFWLVDLPAETTVVFVFLVGPHMAHLSRKLEKVMATRDTPLKVVSHGFAIPGFLPTKISHGLYIYQLAPGVKAHMPLQKQR